MSASIFPLREIMLICNGCGGERMIPQVELEQIDSVETFKRFTDERMAQYACHCGAKSCDLRILMSEAATKEQQDRALVAKEPVK